MTPKKKSSDNTQEEEKQSTGLWTFFGSAKFAVLALVVLSFFSGVGTLIPQNEERAIYLQKYGPLWGKLIITLSMDNLYYAYWFVFLLMLVAINLIFSNLKRFKSLLHAERNLKVATSLPFFTKSAKSIKLTVQGGRELVEGTLKRLGYGIRKEEGRDNEIYYCAEKGRIRRWGSFITHTGILMVFLGAIYGHWPGMGFKGVANMSPEPGSDLYLVKEAGFTLKLIETASKQDESGRPTDFYSHVEVLENGVKVGEKVIRVNDPLEYKGVKFYQSNFGTVGFYIDIIDKEGKPYKIPIELSPEGAPIIASPEPVGKTGLFLFIYEFYPDYSEDKGAAVNRSRNYNNPGAHIYIYENFSSEKTAHNQWNADGWITKDKPLKYKGFTITMGEIVSYTGLQYHKDPGVGVVWLGFVLTTIGLFISFYIPDKNMRILLLPGAQKDNLYIQTHSRLDDSFDREINTFKNSLKES